MSPRKLRAAALGAVAALGLAAAPASAFELAVPKAAPDDTHAGKHSDVHLRIEPKDGQIKDVDIHFPPGLVGAATATDLCTIQQFESDSCPPETQVGTSNTEATVLGLPQTLSGQMFNMQPRGPEPARLGVKIDSPSGTVRLESPVTSRTTDGGLDSTLRDIPNSAGGLSIQITALDITLLGTAKNGKPFMQNPTSCGKAETVVNATAYDGSQAEGRASFDSTNCQELPFAPAFTAELGAPGQTAAGTTPPVVTNVSQTDGQANAKKVSVTLPTALAVAGDRVRRACTQEQFQGGTCPPTATIGAATAVTPLLRAPLSGPVLFVGGNGLPEVVLTLTGPLSLTLHGVNTFTPTGQTTTFDNIPDVPLSTFKLEFLGGADKGILVATRDLCEQPPPQFSATFLSHAGTTSTTSVPATVNGCGAVSPNPPTVKPPARPKVRLRLGPVKGGRPSLNLRVTGNARAKVRKVRLTLAKGLRLSKRTKLRGAKARSKRRVIDIPARAGGTRVVTLKLGAGTITVGRKARRAKRLRFGVVVTDSTGRRTTKRLSVKPRR